LLLSSGRAAGFGIGIARHAAVRLAIPGRRRVSSGHGGGAVIANVFLLGAAAAAGTAHSDARAAAVSNPKDLLY